MPAYFLKSGKHSIFPILMLIYIRLLCSVKCNFVRSPMWTLMKATVGLEWKAMYSIATWSHTQCLLAKSMIHIRERAFMFRFVLFKTVATLKGEKKLPHCLCVIYGLNLLQLSEHELQVWSQFITQGIVKNVFQKNLGTEVTHRLLGSYLSRIPVSSAAFWDMWVG